MLFKSNHEAFYEEEVPRMTDIRTWWIVLLGKPLRLKYRPNILGLPHYIGLKRNYMDTVWQATFLF